MLLRNEFISNEIDRSLAPGETGVLFLGSFHNIENRMVEQLQSLGIKVDVQNECGWMNVSFHDYIQQIEVVRVCDSENTGLLRD